MNQSKSQNQRQIKNNKPKTDNSIGKRKKPLTKRRYSVTINDRQPMSIEKFKYRLKKYNSDYVVTMLGKKARHNIDMFRVVDNKSKAVIADITVNGDLTLNNDYKHSRGLMQLIITFFTTNAKVQHTYTY